MGRGRGRPETVTVVAVDDHDHSMVLRVFEELTGLRGTLETARRSGESIADVPGGRGRPRLQRAGPRREPRSGALQAKLMRYGAAAYMKQRDPGPDEARIATRAGRSRLPRTSPGRWSPASPDWASGSSATWTRWPRCRAVRRRRAGPDPVIPPEIAARRDGHRRRRRPSEGQRARAERTRRTDLDPDARSARGSAAHALGRDRSRTDDPAGVGPRKARQARSEPRSMHGSAPPPLTARSQVLAERERPVAASSAVRTARTAFATSVVDGQPRRRRRRAPRTATRSP